MSLFVNVDDDGPATTLLANGVQGTVSTVRLAIAVHPRLLADTLARAVRRPFVDVIVALDQEVPTGHFDVAVVTGRAPDGLTADAVIRLAEDPGAASPTPVGGGESAVLVVRDLGALLEILDRVLGA